MSDSYLFIDGHCLSVTLQKVSDRYFGGAQVEVDFVRLRMGCSKAYYYDAIPVREHTEAADAYELRTSGKIAELSNIARQDGYHVRAGDARARKGRGREQKMVDVQLAVDMMAFAHRGVFSRATLLTGDLDFKPLVDALVSMGVDVTLQYPQGETNSDLIEAADRATPISIGWVHHLGTDAFRAENPLPQAQYVFKGDAPQLATFFDWNDEQFGHCRLGRDSAGFELMTTDGLDQHQLHVRFADLRTARMYLDEVFSLKLPRDIPGYPSIP